MFAYTYLACSWLVNDDGGYHQITLGINLFCKPVKYECNCPPLIKFRKQMLIKSVNGKTPLIPEDCYVAENATIVGDVSFGESCSVWFNAVIRGRKFHSNRQ
jgi:UDP-3-O-[3-hydroxymyristoyl] glucosamine N-acyltransferase